MDRKTMRMRVLGTKAITYALEMKGNRTGARRDVGENTDNNIIIFLGLQQAHLDTPGTKKGFGALSSGPFERNLTIP